MLTRLWQKNLKSRHRRTKALILLTALLMDQIIGEPSNRWHPVVWMGSFISALRKRAPKRGPLPSFVYGGLIAFGGAGLVGLLARCAVWISESLPFPFNLLMQAWLLKTTFSLRGLDRAAAEVEAALRADDLPEARRLLSWHLVSRDTSQLDAARIAAAAIQSVAENTSDGIVAPLVWYAFGGLPAAMIYRYLNTGDSILGYRDAEREWLGKIPARVDDITNLIPARLTALLFVVLRPQAWHIWWQEAHVTESPNAGHPMSAMAGALDIESEKIDHYVLNAGARLPQADDLLMARRLMIGATALLTLGLIFFLRHSDD